MIIDNKQKQVEIESDGEITQSVDMTIDTGSIGMLMNFLSKNIYSDPIGSPIREWVSNAWDANKKAGVNNPIVVNLKKIYGYKWEFSVEDTALGLDDQDIENTIKKYLCSTKREDNNQLGAIGVGFKSGLAYSNSFTFRCRKNGKERTYMMYEGEFNNKIDLLHEQDTSEPNGVKMVLEVKYSDVSTFSSKIREQLAYFSNTFVIDDYHKFDNDYKIYENELFKWSGITNDPRMHLCLGEVYYPMDFAKLGINTINIPVALKLGLEDGVIPTISRESLMLTPESKQIILDKIKEVANWFVNKYNENVAEFKTFPEAYDFIDVSIFEVSVEYKDFTINSIIPYGTVKPSEPKIEGIDIMSPKFYKDKIHHLLDNYSAIAYDYHNEWKRKHISSELWRRAISAHNSIVVVNYILSGNLKSYLRDKYTRNTLYIEKLPKDSLHWYKQVLWLNKLPKEDWRKVIQEFQFVRKQITDRWFNEEDLHLKDEYITWLAERKALLKEKRESGERTSSYVALNKQKGQITLNIAKQQKFKSSVVYQKLAVETSNLHKLGHLFMVVNKEMDKEELYNWVEAFPKLKFVWISDREKKYIKDLKNFVNMDKIQDTKPFKRMVTGLFIENMLNLSPENEEIIYSAFPKYGELKNELAKYVSENSPSRLDSNFEKAALDIAKEHNLWDMNIYPQCIEYQKIMKKFGFLSFIDINKRYGMTEEELRVVKNMMYIMLKWQKINHELVTDMELVPKVPDEVYDQQAATIEVEEELADVV